MHGEYRSHYLKIATKDNTSYQPQRELQTPAIRNETLLRVSNCRI